MSKRTTDSEEALALMCALGVPPATGGLYLRLLQTGPMPLCQAAEFNALGQPAGIQAIEYLKLFRLISQDIEFRETVLYASDPRSAWKAHDADFYWMRSLHIGDIEALPPLPAMADEERRRRYGELERLCGAIYDGAAKAHDPLRHQHRDIHSDQLFSSWLAAVVSSAEKTIVAVEKPPRLPDLAPIWVALTRRIRTGVTYTRIVGIDEVVEHGLDIVSRDMVEYGIDLRIAPPGLINEAFYIIDNKRLLLKNTRGATRDGRDEHFGVYTSKHPIVRRFAKRFSTHYLPASRSAAPVVARLRDHAASVRQRLVAEERADEANVFDDIVRFGKFAAESAEQRPHRERLVAARYVTRNASGYNVMTVPHGCDTAD